MSEIRMLLTDEPNINDPLLGSLLNSLHIFGNRKCYTVFAKPRILGNIPELITHSFIKTIAKKWTIYPMISIEAICPTLYSRTHHKNKGFWFFACLHGVTKNFCAQGKKNRQWAGNDKPRSIL